MIDLHCHILPGIDDGAKDTAQARGMLAMQQASGVDAMYLTPHFYPEEKTGEEFLAERAKAWENLSASLEPREKGNIRLGAEVRYCRELLSLDLKALTLGGGDYLLLELPGLRYPAYGVQLMEQLLGMGLIPVLAHVERYSYFRQDPALLKRLVDLGVLAQVSARALFDKRDQNFSVACLQHGLAQIVASDAHDTAARKPCMELLGKLPRELRQIHDAVTEAVWENEMPPYLRATNVKKMFFGYR
jgi:protein-tyrosine phosphatase